MLTKVVITDLQPKTKIPPRGPPRATPCMEPPLYYLPTAYSWRDWIRSLALVLVHTTQPQLDTQTLIQIGLPLRIFKDLSRIAYRHESSDTLRRYRRPPVASAKTVENDGLQGLLLQPNQLAN